jgi:hypothetical protein
VTVAAAKTTNRDKDIPEIAVLYIKILCPIG